MRPSFPAFLCATVSIYHIVPCTVSWFSEQVGGGGGGKTPSVRVDVGNTAIRAILTVIKFNCLIKREK